MTAIEIEPYRTQYQDDVIDLILSIQQKEFGILITAEDQPDLKEVSAFYQTGNGNFWVARSGNHILGTIAIKDIGRKYVALRKMFVHQSYRGDKYKIAKKLMDTLVRWCRKKGVTTIYLGTTSKYLAAHRFYEKNGFGEISKEMLPSAFPIMTVDTKFYQLLIGEV